MTLGLLLITSAAWAQSSRRASPEFAPPVHRAPAVGTQRVPASVTSAPLEFQRLDAGVGAEHRPLESTLGDSATADQRQWQPAQSAQRGRTRIARSQNAIYQRGADEAAGRLPGKLVSQSSETIQEPAEDNPSTDPFGDRLPALRTQHDDETTGADNLRAPPARGRAFATSLQQSAEIVDPYQEPTPGKTPRGLDLQRSSATTNDKSCDDFRRELLDKSIVDVDVNISATRAAGPASGVLPREARSWSNVHGTSLGTGNMVDLHHGYVVIHTARGTERIPISQLGDTDLAAVASAWRLPADCTLGDFSPRIRNWIPQTVTWKASNLCHKPLYFEDEQLERYGHSAGPILQPLKSTAHFFVQVATWPYATAIHPINECQYALGFYRPGDCAPWLIDPIPISLSGATREALAVTGLAFILP